MVMIVKKKNLAPIVQRMDNLIQQISHHLVDKMYWPEYIIIFIRWIMI